MEGARPFMQTSVKNVKDHHLLHGGIQAEVSADPSHP
jgi:hypothetical protein